MRTIIFAMLLVLITAVPAFADWELDLKNLSASLNVAASDKDGEREVASTLSLEFNKSQDWIMKKKTKTGLTYGELAIALSMARQINKDVDIIIKDYKKHGHAWGKIAKKYGVRIDDLVHSVGKVNENAKGKGRDKGAEKSKGRGKWKKD